MRFLMLYYFDVDAWQALTAEERERALGRIQKWQNQREHQRVRPQGGELAAPEEAVAVHLGLGTASSAPVLTLGPLAAEPSGRLALGGFELVEAADRDEVVALARSWPTAGAYEIWPLVR